MAVRNESPILNEEREFRIEELFFSITDKKGIIEHRNDVFTRISGYSTEELIGAPHSILRHPDMPRVVFQLLWQTIESGKTIAAYVKNLAKDGRYYWVMAVVMPTPRGYLSIRLKPTSPLLPIVQRIYEELLGVERAIEVEPKKRAEAMTASGKRLGELLLQHGFKDYDSFMQTALATEMSARQRALHTSDSGAMRRVSPSGTVDHAHRSRLEVALAHCQDLDRSIQSLFEYLDEFRATNVLLLDKSTSLLENATVIRFLSMNATVAASRMGARAQTLGVVAESLGEASNQSERIINDLSTEMNSIVKLLSKLIFDVAAIKLQSEISRLFLAELINGVESSSDDVTTSLAILLREVNNRIHEVYQQMTDSSLAFSKLRKRVDGLLRNANTLRFVQFAGLKESQSVEGADSFAVVFEEAKVQVERIRRECEQLCQRVEESQRHVQAITQARGGVTMHAQSLIHWVESQPASILF